MVRVTARLKAAIATAGVLVVVVLYAVLSTQAGGRAWPLPLVLPASVRFHGERYHEEGFAGCRSLAEWSRVQHTPMDAYHTIGRLPSAVYFFGPQMITGIKPDPTYRGYQRFLVKDGGCYSYYQGDFGG